MIWYRSIFADKSNQSKSKKRIVVDFDGTIAYDKGSDIGSPMKGVKEALEELIKQYDVIIFSCRLTDRSDREREQEKERMTKWLNEHEIPFTEIDDGTHGKPISEYIIDNKALNYGGHEGDWEKIVRDILGN
jgi:ribonucleotide monophosphatase NagD (HAD superfamily)